MRALLAAGLLLFALASPVQASPSLGSVKPWLVERLIRQPVDHQTWCGDCVNADYTTGSPWTINPGWVPGYTPPIDTPIANSGVEAGCLWDTDDTYLYETTGSVLEAGQIIAVDECIWQQPCAVCNGGATNYVQWRSSSPDLVIRYEWAWGDGTASYTLPGPVSAQGNWLYQACIRSSGAFGDPIAVPGSHDGQAVYQVLTITVSNPTDRKAGKTGGLMGSDIRDWGTYCRAGTVDPTA